MKQHANPNIRSFCRSAMADPPPLLLVFSIEQLLEPPVVLPKYQMLI